MDTPIPAKISERRKALGLTQEKLGSLLGVSPQAVSKWENADCLPDVLLLRRLCEILRIPADELLGVSPQAGCSEGTALVSAADVRIRCPCLTLAITGDKAVQAIQQTDSIAMQNLLTLLADENALRIFRTLSFTACCSEEALAERCGLSPDAARDALFRLLRRELCQCTPDGYALGCNAYLAYGALAAAWLASPDGRAAIRSITTSYST